MVRTAAAVESVDAAPAAAREWTVADLAARFGSLPAWRIRTEIRPGTATEEDLERHGALCELIDGVLVEKAMSDYSDAIGVLLLAFLSNHVTARRLGWVHGPQGFFWLGANLRAPDAAFTRRQQRPGGLLRRGYSDVAPALVAEVLSPGNTGEEMARKRAEFFACGTELFWIVDPLARTIDVYTRPDRPDATLRDGDVLTGGAVLPDFALPVSELFNAAELSDEPA